MRDHPERFVESNTDNSWLRYLNDMCPLCCHGGWTDLGELATISSTPAWNSNFNPREYKRRLFGVLPGYKRLKDVYCT